MSGELIQVRIPKETKEQAGEIFEAIGLKTGDAIRMFLQQCINKNGLPFIPEVKTSNKETLQAMQELENGDGKRADSLEDTYKDAGI